MKNQIIIYQDTIIKKNLSNNQILLKSGFNIKDRQKWNPSWSKPESVELDKNGFMNVWYLDGDDKEATFYNRKELNFLNVEGHQLEVYYIFCAFGEDIESIPQC